MPNGPGHLRVLSIEGGGTRGLYTASYLESLAWRYAVARKVTGLDVGRGSDLIVGTSTGAVTAYALAAGVPLDRVATLYRNFGQQIFPRKVPKRIGAILANHPRHLRFSTAALEKILRAELRDTILGTAFGRTGASPWRFLPLKCPSIMLGSSKPPRAVRLPRPWRWRATGWPMSVRTARANGRKSAARAEVEHIVAHWKTRMGLVTHTVGLARARAAVMKPELARTAQNALVRSKADNLPDCMLTSKLRKKPELRQIVRSKMLSTSRISAQSLPQGHMRKVLRRKPLQQPII